VHDKAALRGSVQPEILEGEDAVALVDGSHFKAIRNNAARLKLASPLCKFFLSGP